MKVILLLISALLLLQCQSPRLIKDDKNRISPKQTSENYSNCNFINTEINPPNSIIQDETLAGLAAEKLHFLNGHIFSATKNGFLYMIDPFDLSETSDTKISDGIGATISIAEPYIYLSSEKGKYGLTAYNLYTGKTVWELPKFFSRSKAIIVDKRVFHASLDGFVSCFNAVTGKLIWQQKIEQRIISNMALWKNHLVVLGENGLVNAFDSSSGSILWQIELHCTTKTDLPEQTSDPQGKEQNNPDCALTTPPVVNADKIYISTYSGKLFILKQDNGQILQQRIFNSHLYLAPTIDNNNLYQLSADGILTAQSLAKNINLWQIQLKGPARIPVLATKNHLLLGTTQRYFYIIDKHAGTIVQTIKLQGRLSAMPLIVNKKIIISYEYNNIARLESK